MGLLSLDVTSLKVLQKGGKPKEKKYASRIINVVRNHHLLLVTLLLANAAAAETMPVFLGKITSEVVAILISVTAVLLFGEWVILHHWVLIYCASHLLFIIFLSNDASQSFLHSPLLQNNTTGSMHTIWSCHWLLCLSVSSCTIYVTFLIIRCFVLYEHCIMDYKGKLSSDNWSKLCSIFKRFICYTVLYVWACMCLLHKVTDIYVNCWAVLEGLFIEYHSALCRQHLEVS